MTNNINMHLLSTTLSARKSWLTLSLLSLSVFVQATAGAGFQLRANNSYLPDRELSVAAASGKSCLHSSNFADPASQPPYSYRFEVLARYPHVDEPFSEGLAFYQGRLFESTGQWGRSSLRELALNRGTVIRHVELSRYQFGEGLTALNGRLIQLTWKSGEALVYDPDTLEEIGRFGYPGEGWGATVVAQQLVISDGSAQLRFIDPKRFTVARRLTVKQGSTEIVGLNELEFAEGSIFANIWPSDCVAEIDPESGRVLGWLDLTGLLPDRKNLSDTSVLNGIAYDIKRRNWLVTGKNWPYLYRISLQKKSLP